MTKHSNVLSAAKATAPKDTEIISADFETLLFEWLLVRSGERNEETEDEQNEHCERTDDLAQRILTMPAVCDWMIFRKFEVIDYCITKHGEATWGEMMALTALDGIKADLLTFGIMREAKLVTAELQR